MPDGAIIGQASDAKNVWYVIGSYAPDGTANSSSVLATKATVYGDIIAGDGAGGASGNTVNVTGTTVTRYVYGGRCDNNKTFNDSASDNKVILKGNSNVGEGVAGGFTNYGSASGNTVEVLEESTVGGSFLFMGGYALSGTASSNHVTISGKSQVNVTVYGGFASAEASSNEVHLEGSTAAFGLYGGYAHEGTANSNSVTGKDSTVGWEVYGGQGKKGASPNTVNLDNVQVKSSVRGGDTVSGDASGNSVLLSNGTTFTGDLYAGYTEDGNASGNEVSLSGVSAPQNVYASYTKKGQAGGSVKLTNRSTVEHDVYGGFTLDGVADGGNVTGSGSTVRGSVYGGQGTTGASSNTVDLGNVQVTGSVRGGNTKSGDASGNSVTLSNGTTFTGDLYAGYTEDGNASDNEVSLSGVSAPHYVYASYTTKGQAGGSVTLTNKSSVAHNVYGGFTHDGVAAGSKVTGDDSTVGDGVTGGQGTTGALSNTVELNKVQVKGYVRGGYTDKGNASENKVSLSNGTTFTGDLYAGYTEDGNASGNEVSLSGVSAPQNVYASYTTKGQAGGSVKLTNSSVTYNVFGGYTESGAANNSSVTIINSDVWSDVGSDVGSSVYAGRTNSGEANHNSVTVSGHSSIQGRIYGGYGSLDTSYNTVELTDVSHVGDDVVGGHSAGDSSTPQHVLYNTVSVLSGSKVDSGIYGGVITEGLGTVQYNTVNLDHASAGYDVVGGGVLLDAPTGNAEENHVNISAGTVEGSVYGGVFEYSFKTDPGNSDIRNNTVSLSEGAVVNDSVYGGYNSGIGDVTGNEVTVAGSRVDGDVYGGMNEGNDDNNPGSVSQNKVRIESGSTVSGSVYGGWNSSGEASGNFIYVNGTVSEGLSAGHTLSGDATGNEVLVEGGTVLKHLYGGYTALGNATGNVITVKGGTVNAELAGGYDDGTATENTVTLYDSASFTGSDIYGGRSSSSSSDVFTGNTFNVHGQIDAASLQNFQNLNFYDVVEDKASVDLSRSAIIGDGKGSMTNVSIENLRNQEGDIAEEYVLIHTPTVSSSFSGTNLYVNGDTVVTIGPDGSYVPYSGTVANDGTMDNATGSTGMTKNQTLTKGFLTFEVDYFIKNGQDLIARWKKDAPVEVNPETEDFTASRQASAALMDEGADFVAGEGIDRALQASQCLPGEPCGAKAFMAVNGGYSTYKAGTTFDMSYGNMLAGIARQCKVGPMGYLAGVFFETGIGRFHSEYEPDDSRSIDSEGHDSYYGVGALAKVFLNRDLLKGLYAEGSIRYGIMTSDWQSHDISINGRTADWDGRAPYLTAHGGLGYMWDVTDNVTADVYAKYFWGHLWGDDGSICGQKFEFDDIYSSRVRTGARLNFRKDESFSWYLGGAWEHQFDAKSRGSIYGYDVPSTDLRGNTAIAEAGIYFKPKADSDLSFMLGTTGYFGEKREGVTGHLQVRYDF